MDPITLGVMAAGAGLSAYSASQASKGQQQANEQQMVFNARQAQDQRNWEQMMFENRYRMTRKDLEAAGYNPIMALGLNPGVPSGASASATPQSTTRESSQIMSQSALQAANLMKLKAETRLTDSMTGTQATQQALNLANAKQAGFNAQSKIPGSNIPFSVFGINAQSARGAAGSIRNFARSGFKSFGD